MEDIRGQCEVCGKPARVRVLERYAGGGPVFRHYCLDCADRQHESGSHPPSGPSGQRLSIGSILMVTGLFIVLIAVLGDHLGIRGLPGFGWRQALGLLLGAALVSIGAVLRTDVVAVFGTLVFALAALSDLFGFQSAEGLGWKQRLAIVIGVSLTALGLVMRLAYGRRSRPRRD